MKAKLIQKLEELRDAEFWKDVEPNRFVVEATEGLGVAMCITSDDRIIVGVAEDDWLNEELMMEVQKWIFEQIWGETLHLADKDYVLWDVQLGCNFHGIPDGDLPLFAVAQHLGIDPTAEQDVSMVWVSVKLTDYAS